MISREIRYRIADSIFRVAIACQNEFGRKHSTGLIYSIADVYTSYIIEGINTIKNFTEDEWGKFADLWYNISYLEDKYERMPCGIFLSFYKWLGLYGYRR